MAQPGAAADRPVEAPLVSPTPAEQSVGRIPLRLKFIIALAGLSLLPFVFIALHVIATYNGLLDSILPLIPDEGARAAAQAQASDALYSATVIGVVLAILIAVGAWFAERFFIGEVRILLAWLKDAREHNFKALTAPPVISQDEIGDLGREMQAAIQYFQVLEEREKQIIKQKSEFISVAAHQMRTPLTGLRWGIETLLSPSLEADKRKRVGEGVSGTVERMIGLVNDLLDAAAMEEGRFGYEFKKVDLVPVMQSVLKHFALIVEGKKVKLDMRGPDLLEVFVDPNRISVAVTNLVSNAIDYTKEGGTVTIELKDEGNRVRVTVIDTGIGIPREFIPELFGKFTRAENAIKMRPDGSGLGLYVVRNIVERHGSEMHVESEPGKGSRFSFTVPKKEADLIPRGMSVEDFFGKF